MDSENMTKSIQLAIESTILASTVT